MMDPIKEVLGRLFDMERSLARIEENLKYHIRRTDLVEEDNERRDAKLEEVVSLVQEAKGALRLLKWVSLTLATVGGIVAMAKALNFI
jgi:hypothetical protein